MTSWSTAAEASQQALARRVLATLEQRYAWEYRALGEPEARRRIQAGLAAAHRQGLRDTAQVVLFVLGQVLAEAAEPGFDEAAWASTCRRGAAGRGGPAGMHRSVGKGPLTIRAAQLDAFACAAKDRTRERLLEHLRRVFPERMRTLSQVAALALIDAGLATAARHGIQDARSVTLLTDLVVVKGPAFEDSEAMRWSGAILRSPSIPAGSKAGLILRMLQQQGSEVPDANNR
jgi:hypothetical protein